jgi:hypothetical protein
MHMSQAADEPTAPITAAVTAAVTGTGHQDVDAALAALDGVEQRPLDEQVVALEAAHETLRAVLAGAGQASTGSA